MKISTKPDIRYLKDMKEVIYDKQWLKTAPESLELYYMYRGINPAQILPKAKIMAGKEKRGLRCDITVIPSRMLGQEFVKTKGHYHSDKYQEVYMVLNGEAIFLFQKNKGKIVEDVLAIKAQKGDVIIVPPNYGHITINPSKQELKIANWISENCQNVYSIFKKMKGACYFYTKNGWIKNKNYSKIPKLRFEKPLKSMPKNLDFLK